MITEDTIHAEKRVIVPSIFQQTKWECGYFDLPAEHGVRYFNPSIARWHDRTWLATRRAIHDPPPLGTNSLVVWQMNDVVPKSRHPIRFHLTHPQEHYEDPRLVVLDNELFVSCTNFKIANYHAHQVLARISNVQGEYCPTAHICYGKNGPSMDKNLGNEKNWVWFQTELGWHFVYEPWPHHVVRTNLGEAAASYVEVIGNPCPWSWGKMRGGSPPILVNGYYYSFFHSSVEAFAPEPRRRYYMGAYAFESKPPFHMRSITIDPLLVGSEKDGGTLPVVFPGGAIHDGEEWLVVLGVNDWRSAYLRIPHKELCALMMEI